MLKAGHYTTKDGHQARIDMDIRERGIGVVRDVGYVTYNAQGEVEYKQEHGIGDSLDLVLPEREQA